jgi:hypothetical protein
MADTAAVARLQARQRANAREVSELVRRASHAGRQLSDDEWSRVDAIVAENEAIDRDLEVLFYGGDESTVAGPTD